MKIRTSKPAFTGPRANRLGSIVVLALACLLIPSVSAPAQTANPELFDSSDAAIAALKTQDFGIELKFGNFRTQ